MPLWFVISAFGLFGLLFGSFANVVIWRLPRGESLAAPGSHCPACQTPIAWYDNVPLVSYAVLRGRCRACRAPIAARYPLVEAASGALFALAAWHFESVGQAAFAAVLFWFALVLGLIDLEHFRLPNPLVGALTVFGLAGVVLSHVIGSTLVPLVGMADAGWLSSPFAVALTGALVAGGLAFAVGEIYARVLGASGMGFGDVKFLGALGIFLGLHALSALIIASIIGSVYGVAVARRQGESLRDARVPLGAFLAIGAIVAAVAGPELWAGYLRLVGM